MHVILDLANYTDWCSLKVVSKKPPLEKSNHKVVVEIRMSQSEESNSVTVGNHNLSLCSAAELTEKYVKHYVWIIPACTWAKYNAIILCAWTTYALQHILAYKLTYGRCDMHVLCILIYDYCIISLYYLLRRSCM